MTEKHVFDMPLPTEYESELLDILIEEAAEVIQRATKLKRFGRDEVQPGQSLNNAVRLSLEIGDFIHMVNLAVDAGLANDGQIDSGMLRKQAQLQKYMRTTKP